MGLSAHDMVSPGDPAADLQMAREAAAGDPSARRALVDRLFDRVRRTASYLAGGGADAEDLAQLALVRILGSAGGFRGESTLERWAERVTVRTAAKELEKRARRRRLLESGWCAPPASGNAEEDAEAHRIRDRLVAAFGRLALQSRTAMALHYLHGYGIAEVAGLTGAPVNTVRGRLRAGREQLREIIAADPLLRQWVEEQTT